MGGHIEDLLVLQRNRNRKENVIRKVETEGN